MLPREKMIINGPKELKDEELLAIMLSSGTKNENVFDMSKRLIKEYGFSRLFKMNYEELSKIPGIKKAKATKLMANFEITRRIIENKTSDIKLLETIDVFNYIYPDYIDIDYELLSVIYVDIKMTVIKIDKYTDLLKSKLKIPFRNIINNALNLNVFGFFLVHNHPAGNINPSKEDIIETNELLKICNQIGIILFDHIIISKGTYLFINKYLNENNFFNF